MSTVAAALQEQKHGRRGISFVLFLVFEAAVFLPSQVVRESREVYVSTIVFVVFSASTILVNRSRLFRTYGPVFFSFSLASFALLMTWLFADWPLRWLRLNPTSPHGIAVGKLSVTVLAVVPVIVLARLFRFDLGSFYLQKGRLKLGLAIGFITFAIMATIGVAAARSLGVDMGKIIQWTPWILIFILANGFMEELLTRGIFLRKYEPFLGRNLSNLATALVFAIGHSWVTYASDLAVLLALAFAFALMAGYMMQKTEAIWASALFHAGADTLIVIGMFAGVKT